MKVSVQSFFRQWSSGDSGESEMLVAGVHGSVWVGPGQVSPGCFSEACLSDAVRGVSIGGEFAWFLQDREMCRNFSVHGS